MSRALRLLRLAPVTSNNRILAPLVRTSCRSYTAPTDRIRHRAKIIPKQFRSADPEVEGYKTRHTVESRVLKAVMELPKFREHPQLAAIAQELTDPKRVGPHDSLSSITLNDLQVDSLDKVELLVAVEREFDTEFSDSEFEKFTSVGQIIEHILWLPQAN
jgi:acyl carrier protein